MLMRRVAAVVLVAGSVACGQGGPQAGAQAGKNAALDYWRAGTLAAKPGKDVKDSAISALDWSAIGLNLDPAKMPEGFKAAKEEISETAVQEFLKGAAEPRCDFQVRFEEGWYMPLPELAMMRNLTRHVHLDARLKLMDGDAAGATERVVAIYRASGHVAHEDVLIATLVASAMAGVANDEVKALVASGKLSRNQRADLLAAIRSLREGDGLRFKGALEGERAFTAGWLKKTYTGPDAGARLKKEMASMHMEGKTDEPLMERVGAMKPEEFSAAVTKLDGLYTELIKAWDAPDRKGSVGAIDERVHKGDYGLLAEVLAPAMSNVAAASEKAEAGLDATQAVLKGP